MNNLREAVEEYLKGLDDRERNVIAVGIPVVLLLLFIALVFLPLKGLSDKYGERLKKLERKEELLKPKLAEIQRLREKLSPVERKVERGRNADISSLIRSAAKRCRLKVKRVKVLESQRAEGIVRKKISVEFSEAELDRVACLIRRLESGRYYFKAVAVSLSDYDKNEYVSGRVTFYFFGRER